MQFSEYPTVLGGTIHVLRYRSSMGFPERNRLRCSECEPHSFFRSPFRGSQLVKTVTRRFRPKSMPSVRIVLILMAIQFTAQSRAGEVCYSCFFHNNSEVTVEKVASFFQNFQTKDPLLSGDARYIVWRATG